MALMSIVESNLIRVNRELLLFYFFLPSRNVKSIHLLLLLPLALTDIDPITFRTLCSVSCIRGAYVLYTWCE